MAQLRQDYGQFKAKGAEILVIGPDGPAAFRDYWTRHEMPCVGLPDPDHTVAGLYGQQVKLLKLGRMPALVIVDREGCVRYRHYGDAMSDIPDNRALLAALDELG